MYIERQFDDYLDSVQYQVSTLVDAGSYNYCQILLFGLIPYCFRFRMRLVSATHFHQYTVACILLSASRHWMDWYVCYHMYILEQN